MSVIARSIYVCRQSFTADKRRIAASSGRSIGEDTTPSTPPLTSLSEKKSRSRLTATTSTGAPLLMCSYPMARTSTTNSSNRAGAGGIGSMRQEIRCWKSWRRKHERDGKACGPIRSRCRRGSGGSGSQEMRNSRSCDRHSCLSTVATNLLADAFKPSVPISVGHFASLQLE